MVVLIYAAFAMPTIKVIIHFMQSSQFAMLKKNQLLERACTQLKRYVAIMILAFDDSLKI